MRIAALALATVLALAGAGIASAAAPERERRTIDIEFVDDESCEAFDILAHFEGSITTTEFRDADGEVTREVVHRQLRGSMTNLETGTAYPLREADKVTFHPDGSASFTGSLLHVFAPGGRTIAVIAGREVIDADSDQLAAHGRFDDLCAALS